MAGLFKYFKPSLPTNEETGLGEVVLKEVNQAVEVVLKEQNADKGKRPRKRSYTHFNPEDRAKLAKYAAQCGSTATVKHFRKDFPTLGESTVRSFRSQYLAEIKKVGLGEEICELAKKKRGRPFTLGDMDAKVQLYVKSLRRAGVAVNARLVLAAAEGIVKASDRALLVENGGYIHLTLAWAYSILKRMGFVQRKASTKTKTSLSKEEFESLKKTFLKTITKVVKDSKIPPELVINWDQTGVNVVPSSQWTQAERGSSRVEVVGVGDKRQITVTAAGTLSGNFLPFQILYGGKTERCHPSISFPKGFDIWHTPNHWANAETSLRFVTNVILPYISATRKELGLSDEHMALVIFDCFRGHTGDEMKSLLLENNVLTVMVPNNCTDLLQPLDLSVNKPLKDHLRRSFQTWYSDQVTQELERGKEAENIKVDLRLSIVKPLSAKWIISAYDYLRQKPGIIRNGFVEAGIVEALDAQVEPEDCMSEGDPFDFWDSESESD